MHQPTVNFCIVAAVALASLAARAEVFEIFPEDANADCSETFEQQANSLDPGDVLILHDGVYTQSCRRNFTVNGAPDNWITIRAAAGASPLLTRPPENLTTQNNLEVVDSSFLRIEGLRFEGGSIGVRFMGGHDIVFADNEVSATGSSAITLNSGNTERMQFLRNEVHHTGLGPGNVEGEGFYVGCNNANCTSHDGLYEDNYIHHLRGTSSGGNDGIEIKFGSGGNIVRGNHIHDTIIGTQYPCIFAYGGGNAPNIIENNLLYRCGEAIQVAADAIVRNNVVFDSTIQGLTAASHSQVGAPRNLVIVNNTFADHPTCARLRFSSGSNILFANNVLHCEGSEAIDGGSLSNAVLTGNYVAGSLSGASVDGSTIIAAGSSAANFADASGRDYRLLASSILRDGGSATAQPPAADFDGTPRPIGSAIDAGAFEFLTPGSGDFNADGVINLLDLVLFRAVYVIGDPQADLNSDGAVNLLDLVVFRYVFFTGT